QQNRQVILATNLETATAAAYDGSALELAFPPGRKFSVQKVEQRMPQLLEAFAAVFGVTPRIVCSERGAPASATAVVEEDDPVPGVSRPRPRRHRDLRGGGVEGPGRHREGRGSKGPLPYPGWGHLAAGGDRTGRPPCPGVAGPGGPRRRGRGHHGHQPEPGGQ